MIISRTPFRISFFGGGTDYPAWYTENGGAVLATSIDKYCYISVRWLPPFFEHKHRIIYSQVENVRDVSEIRHPSVKAVMQHLKIDDGVEIHHDGDLPARSGLGSSSAFTSGLLNAMKALRGEFISKEALARTAIHIEQNVIGEAVGSQDQIATAIGGFNRVDFKQDGSFSIAPVIMRHERRLLLQNNLMLFFTGISRYSTEVAKTKIDNFQHRVQELNTIRQMVDEAANVILSPESDLDEIGKLLHESWMLKRSLSKSVSNARIDECYAAARKAGALGGKVLGAGGGGFMLFYVRPENQSRVRAALKDLLYVSFKFENEGSKIVVYDENI